jgi:phage tail sheath protein FI
MPAARTYPGVYIEEVSSGVHPIIGVATSITAFVGRALRGPTDRPGRVQSFADFERMYGGLWAVSTLGYAVQQFFANGGSDAVIVRVQNGAARATLGLGTINLVAASEGEWGERLRVRIDTDTRPLLPTEAPGTLFNLSVRDMATRDTERFLNISVDPDHARFVTRVLELESNLLRVTGPVGVAAPPANPALASPGADPFDPATLTSTAFNADGLDGVDVTQAQIIGPVVAPALSALQILDQVDLFNLLCITPFARDAAGDVTLPVWDAAATYCRGRRAVLIVDPPSGWDEPADILAGGAALGTVVNRTNSASIYFPRILAADPLKEFRPETFAPCGAVAGVIARTDAERGVWKAPAGLDATLVGVSALSLGGEPGFLTDPQIGLLNPFGVNCLRTIPNTGHVVWGARTLDGADNLASEWKYLPVRRTALFIEESLFRGTQWAVFEPNDEPLWSQLRLNCNTFMQGLFRQGAFQGTSPREAYFVKCSRETTTQGDIDAGIVNVLIGFAPLKPAEFVVIRIQQMTQQST